MDRNTIQTQMLIVLFVVIALMSLATLACDGSGLIDQARSEIDAASSFVQEKAQEAQEGWTQFTATVDGVADGWHLLGDTLESASK